MPETIADNPKPDYKAPRQPTVTVTVLITYNQTSVGKRMVLATTPGAGDWIEAAEKIDPVQVDKVVITPTEVSVYVKAASQAALDQFRAAGFE